MENIQVLDIAIKLALKTIDTAKEICGYEGDVSVTYESKDGFFKLEIKKLGDTDNKEDLITTESFDKELYNLEVTDTHIKLIPKNVPFKPGVRKESLN